jgi:hypothetical protein
MAQAGRDTNMRPPFALHALMDVPDPQAPVYDPATFGAPGCEAQTLARSFFFYWIRSSQAAGRRLRCRRR